MSLATSILYISVVCRKKEGLIIIIFYKLLFISQLIAMERFSFLAMSDCFVPCLDIYCLCMKLLIAI